MPVCECLQWQIIEFFRCVCVCACVPGLYLNGSICSGTCSSVVSLRLDSISAIPLTFSTKRRQESTRALTLHPHTHTPTITHSFGAHKHKHFSIFAHVNRRTRRRRRTNTRGQTPVLACAGCVSGTVADVASSVSRKMPLPGAFIPFFCTQANQTGASLCTIFASHTLRKSPAPPATPPSPIRPFISTPLAHS